MKISIAYLRVSSLSIVWFLLRLLQFKIKRKDILMKETFSFKPLNKAVFFRLVVESRFSSNYGRKVQLCCSEFIIPDRVFYLKNIAIALSEY